MAQIKVVFQKNDKDNNDLNNKTPRWSQFILLQQNSTQSHWWAFSITYFEVLPQEREYTVKNDFLIKHLIATLNNGFIENLIWPPFSIMIQLVVVVIVSYKLNNKNLYSFLVSFAKINQFCNYNY